MGKKGRVLVDLFDALRADDAAAVWLRELRALPTDDHLEAEVTLPEPTDLPAALLDLAVPFEDVNALVALGVRVARDAELAWLFERAVRAQLREIGTVGRPAATTALPESLGALGRYLPVLVFVATAPHVRLYHRARGVAPEVSRQTLADLGRQMAVHRRRHGTGGLLTPSWLTPHFRGELYQLGRLQFQRSRLNAEGAEREAVEEYGEECLELHVPDFSGPLTPDACDRSLAQARAFFARCFPEERYRVAVMSSWLLDTQLGRYLPPESNIVRLQRRFTPSPRTAGPNDSDPLGFVFGDPDIPLERLPRDTSVQRALVDHLRQGGHWYQVHGWFAL